MTTQTQATDAFKKLLQDQVTRVESMQAELAKLEEKSQADARTFIDEWARLARESVSYAAQMSAEWRKMSLEATKRTIEAFTPRA